MKTTLKELWRRKVNREIRQIREREFGFLFSRISRGSRLNRMLVDFIFSAVRRGIVVAAKIKPGFKLRLVAVRKHRNRPPRSRIAFPRRPKTIPRHPIAFRFHPIVFPRCRKTILRRPKAFRFHAQAFP